MAATLGAAAGTPCSVDAASGSVFAAAREMRGGEPSSLPELRRMLSSLDRVDRRIFALGSHGGASEDAEDAEDQQQERGVDNAPPAEGVTTEAAVPEGTHVIGASTEDGVSDAADCSLQQASRARERRLREAAAEAAELEACAMRQRRRDEAAVKIQVALRRAQARHRARAATEERQRREGRQRRRKLACATLERAWEVFAGRRRAGRELAEARARVAAVAAVAAAARRAEDTARAVILVQAVWRGGLARVSVRRLKISRARSRAGHELGHVGVLSASVTGATLPVDVEVLQQTPPTDTRLADIATTPRPRPLAAPSTFYNQLSQDPRRHCRLPEAHLAATTPLPSAGLAPLPRALAASHGATGGVEEAKGERPGVQSGRFGPRPLARSAGAGRPPRFADLETARIARIMKGNLQHWAGVRSGGGGSSSSDDFDL